MISENHPLIQLLHLVDLVWAEPESPQSRGTPKTYSERTMFKVYLVSVVKKRWHHRSLWRFLSAHPMVAEACELEQIPHRRTLDRRLREIAPVAEEQIRTLGLMLSVELVTDGCTAASDGSAFETPGPVWHKKDKKLGRVPDGLSGLDTEADWIHSSYHGWVYGYQAHVTISVSTATVRVVLDATVTGSACESHVLKARVDALPKTIDSLLLDAGYDDGSLIEQCHQHGMDVLVPLSKPVGKSTSQTRKDRAAYLSSPRGKSRYRQRGSSIEPFFATLKDFFGLDPLPLSGRINASVCILLALYAWNLIVLFNFIHDRPLGAVKSFLDVL